MARQQASGRKGLKQKEGRSPFRGKGEPARSRGKGEGRRAVGILRRFAIDRSPHPLNIQTPQKPRCARLLDSWHRPLQGRRRRLWQPGRHACLPRSRFGRGGGRGRGGSEERGREGGCAERGAVPDLEGFFRFGGEGEEAEYARVRRSPRAPKKDPAAAASTIRGVTRKIRGDAQAGPGEA